MKQVYVVDEYGYIIDLKQISKMENLPNHIEVPLPTDAEAMQLKFYKARWDGEKWVEGLTEEEIYELNKLQERELTEIDKLKLSQAEQFETILELLGGMM